MLWGMRLFGSGNVWKFTDQLISYQTVTFLKSFYFFLSIFFETDRHRDQRQRLGHLKLNFPGSALMGSLKTNIFTYLGSFGGCSVTLGIRLYILSSW